MPGLVYFIDDDISHIEDNEWYESDTFDLQRNSLDNQTNNFGKDLLNFILSMVDFQEIVTVHLRFVLTPVQVWFVVDYILASTSLFNNTIENFTVDSRSDSDHLPIIIQFSCRVFQANANDIESGTKQIHRYKAVRGLPKMSIHFVISFRIQIPNSPFHIYLKFWRQAILMMLSVNLLTHFRRRRHP